MERKSKLRKQKTLSKKASEMKAFLANNPIPKEFLK